MPVADSIPTVITAVRSQLIALLMTSLLFFIGPPQMSPVFFSVFSSAFFSSAFFAAAASTFSIPARS